MWLKISIIGLKQVQVLNFKTQWFGRWLLNPTRTSGWQTDATWESLCKYPLHKILSFGVKLANMLLIYTNLKYAIVRVKWKRFCWRLDCRFLHRWFLSLKFSYYPAHSIGELTKVPQKLISLFISKNLAQRMTSSSYSQFHEIIGRYYSINYIMYHSLDTH